jgi:hypothetical protein
MHCYHRAKFQILCVINAIPGVFSKKVSFSLFPFPLMASKIAADILAWRWPAETCLELVFERGSYK